MLGFNCWHVPAVRLALPRAPKSTTLVRVPLKFTKTLFSVGVQKSSTTYWGGGGGINKIRRKMHFLNIT